jgi:signal transduction histidine kinase/CheY-like chemotaxis protein
MQMDATGAPGSLLDYQAVTGEVKENAFRAMMAAFVLFLLGWYLAANIIVLLGDIVHVSLVILVALVGTGLGVLLLGRSYQGAALAWLAGFFLAHLLAMALFRQPELVFLYALLPLLVLVVSFRWQWGAAALAAEAVLLLFLRTDGGLAFSALSWYTSREGAALLAGALGLAIAAGFARSMLSMTSWSLINYRKMRAEVEQLRNERVELLQVQEDFALANKELARLSERLAGMTQVAEEARRIKEDFVARVSHELRTPLNMILGFSEVMMKSPQLYGDSIPPAMLADIDAILRNSQHLSRLVDDILDLSQVEAGRMALSKEWTDVPVVMDEAISAVKGLYDSKGLYLRQQVCEPLPPIFCDCTRIRQVLINLLGNAARFTEQGGVQVEARLEGGAVILSVQDTGPGIDPSEQKRIFEPFHQVDGLLRRHKGGTGLGLTISKQFVEMHGGKMWLESTPGLGASFFFSLPAQLSPPEHGEGATRWFNRYFQYEPRTHLANLPDMTVKPRFVLVEQEDSLRRLFTRYADNVEVVGVKHIDEAVQEAARLPVQALVVNSPADPHSPQAQAELSRLPFNTPVIHCWLPGQEEAARQLGVVQYLVKPVSHADVLGALAQIPGARRVLLVDDEPEILRLFVRMLSAVDQPYTLIQAMNGHRALKLLRGRKPDVMLLDLAMPEMDGYQVLREKSLDPEIAGIPVIVISSQNPHGESTVSKTFSVTRGGGLSAHELLNCVQTVTRILGPEAQTAGRAQPESPDATPVS